MPTSLFNSITRTRIGEIIVNNYGSFDMERCSIRVKLLNSFVIIGIRSATPKVIVKIPIPII